MLSGGSVQKLTPSNSLVAQTGAFYFFSFFFFFFLFFFVEGGKKKKKKPESPTKSVLAEPRAAELTVAQPARVCRHERVWSPALGAAASMLSHKYPPRN